MIHDFKKNLRYSNKAEDHAFWVAIYKELFPNLVDIERCRDIKRQKQGIDTILFLSNGAEIKIDEKKRREVYPDILLEYISVDRTNAPGWMEKDLKIDYLAYAKMPLKVCYLLPWSLLRRAWLYNKKEWMSKYKHVKGKNATYTTWSIAIPTDVLKKAIMRACLIEYKEQELPYGERN